MGFGGFVSLNDNKRIIFFDECLVQLNSLYNKNILIMIIPVLQMRKLWFKENLLRVPKSEVGLESLQL